MKSIAFKLSKTEQFVLQFNDTINKLTFQDEALFYFEYNNSKVLLRDDVAQEGLIVFLEALEKRNY